MRRVVVAAALAGLAVLLTSGCGAGPSDAAAGSPAGSASEAATAATAESSTAETVSPLPTETTVTASPEPSQDTSTAAPTETPPVDGQSASDLTTALEQALAATTEALVTDALDGQGVTLASGPSCAADLTAKKGSATATGTVTCRGTSDDGRGVDGTFDGTVTAGGVCEGRLVIRVGGTVVVQRQVTECGVDVP